MTKVFTTLKFLIIYLLSYIPTRLPVTLEEMQKFQNEIIVLAGAFADEDSLKWAISNMVLHADTNNDKLSKQYFVKRLRKAAANQLVSFIINDIKNRQQAAMEAAKAAEQAKQLAETEQMKTNSEEKV